MHYELELNIEKLTLSGFTKEQARQINSSLQYELNRLFNTYGIPKSLANNQQITPLNVNNIKATSNVKPRQLGFQTAKTIYAALSQNSGHVKSAKQK